MEIPTPVVDDQNVADTAPLPKGPILYVAPLRMLPPSGVYASSFPSSHHSFNSSNPDGFIHEPRGPSIFSEFHEVGSSSSTCPVSDPNVMQAPRDDLFTEHSKIPDISQINKSDRPSSSQSDAKKPRRSGSKTSTPVDQQGIDMVRIQEAVIATRRLYDAVRRMLLQKEEINGKVAGKRSRADLEAGAVVSSRRFYDNRSKVVGTFPGVEVGDQFYYRMELCCIGMHGAIQAGIEYLTSKDSQWNIPVAISIISSGGYDNRDDGETLIYTGQGGKTSFHKTNENQKLERGNLAMEGSMKFEVPVRVIRGMNDASSPSGKIYTYDGIYKVEECWSERGKNGFQEFKFKLQRLPGQPELGSVVIKLANQIKHEPSTREGLHAEDISRGMENIPVCVVNTVDDENPHIFEYSTKVQYPCRFDDLQLPMGCECKGVCSASRVCLCFSRNGDQFAYLNSGVLVKQKDMVYECGDNCTCPADCSNRITQNGLKRRLEIFRTEKKGWGVRSWDSIPAGSFICEYTGKAAQNTEGPHTLHSKPYVLNLNVGSSNKTIWGDVSGIVENEILSDNRNADQSAWWWQQDLLIDASEVGNVARFINHSSSPNLLAQPVLHDHHDLRFPHIMLFAMDNIPPFRELTLDYCFNEFSTGFKGNMPS